VRGKLDRSEKLWRRCSPCRGRDGGDNSICGGTGDSPAFGCGHEARGLWGVLAAHAGGREEGTKRSGSDGVALPFYISAVEVGDGPVSDATWKEEGGRVWYGEGGTRR
jgi:hypothetical protein